MWSLRSSSALAYNVFEPWRGQDILPVASALNATVSSNELRFEQKYPHGLPHTPPNIDFVLDACDAQPLGVECKFTEPYGCKDDHVPIADKYLTLAVVAGPK
jgi:hypothetical protein